MTRSWQFPGRSTTKGTLKAVQRLACRYESGNARHPVNAEAGASDGRKRILKVLENTGRRTILGLPSFPHTRQETPYKLSRECCNLAEYELALRENIQILGRPLMQGKIGVTHHSARAKRQVAHHWLNRTCPAKQARPDICAAAARLRRRHALGLSGVRPYTGGESQVLGLQGWIHFDDIQ